MPKPSKPILCSIVIALCFGCGQENVAPVPEVIAPTVPSRPRNLPASAVSALPAALVKAQTLSAPGRSWYSLGATDLTPLNSRRVYDREKAIERELRALRATYMREATDEGEARLRALERQRKQFTSAVVDESSGAFRSLADEKGAVFVELSNYIGYPDKNQPPRVKPDWVLNQDEKVQQLRKRIAELNAAYDAASATARLKANREFDLKIAQLRTETAIAEDQALQRAEREVRELFKERAGQAAQHLKLSSITAPAQPPLRSGSTDISVNVASVASKSSTVPEMEGALRALWKRLNPNGRHSKPRESFEDWRRKFLAGR